MAENNWLLQDGRSILVEFETAAAAKAWGWFGNRSSGEGLEFDAAAAEWANHAWLRGGQMVQAAESGVAVNYVLTCASGNYVYTAQAATLTRGYSLSCSAGAYIYTGNAATLTYVPGASAANYTLTCDSGNYTYTGNDATLVYVAGTAEQQNSGGWPDYSRHPYYRPVRKKEQEEYIHKQADLEEEIAQVEVEMVFKDQRKIAVLERKLEALKEELDNIKVLNALIAEQAEEQLRFEEEELIVLLLAA